MPTAPERREHELELIKQKGHRRFVGGKWDAMGRLQFDFLVSQGLEPRHVFLDVGCGALRGGKHFIQYLEPGNYLGIDLHQELLDAGAKDEVGPELMESRRPELIASSDFEFDRFGKRPDFALAQSLFSHLTPDDITYCLGRLRSVANEGCAFWATFYHGNSDRNPEQSHSRRNFHYSPEEMASFGEKHGWEAHYHGEWGHPRGQVMVRYTAPTGGSSG